MLLTFCSIVFIGIVGCWAPICRWHCTGNWNDTASVGSTLRDGCYLDVKWKGCKNNSGRYAPESTRVRNWFTFATPRNPPLNPTDTAFLSIKVGTGIHYTAVLLCSYLVRSSVAMALLGVSLFSLITKRKSCNCKVTSQSSPLTPILLTPCCSLASCNCKVTYNDPNTSNTLPLSRVTVPALDIAQRHKGWQRSWL